MATAFKAAKKALSKKQASQTVAEKFRHVYGLLAELGRLTESDLATLRGILANESDARASSEARIAELERRADAVGERVTRVAQVAHERIAEVEAHVHRKRWWQR